MVRQTKLTGVLNATLDKIKNIDVIKKVLIIDQLTPLIEEGLLKIKITADAMNLLNIDTFNQGTDAIITALQNIKISGGSGGAPQMLQVALSPIGGNTTGDVFFNGDIHGFYLRNDDPAVDLKFTIKNFQYLLKPGEVFDELVTIEGGTSYLTIDEGGEFHGYGLYMVAPVASSNGGGEVSEQSFTADQISAGLFENAVAPFNYTAPQVVEFPAPVNGIYLRNDDTADDLTFNYNGDYYRLKPGEIFKRLLNIDQGFNSFEVTQGVSYHGHALILASPPTNTGGGDIPPA